MREIGGTPAKDYIRNDLITLPGSDTPTVILVFLYTCSVAKVPMNDSPPVEKCHWFCRKILQAEQPSKFGMQKKQS
ncbi:uncharacterized protein LOC110117318 isoform X2 [Athalia rosae]|uniref:uncharacterized protein LOC110117318 isoform X2 n=1 Tax=Athalia rosae TaxID=37344 RepID=UPI00203449F3|nr:uncharacterized protein LOC110117318 isoform X2 [Athalia rosae]